MDIRPIRTETDYDAALAEVAALMETAEPGSAAADRMDVLTTLIEAYETEHHPIGPADPVEMIKFVMEQRGIGRAELAEALGSKARVSEILNRRRRLTTRMIWALSRKLGIPADSLVRPYELAPAKRAKAGARRGARGG